jgi:hypothetical protein
LASEPAAEVAGNIDERRALVGLIGRQLFIGDGVDRNEQKRQGNHLIDPDHGEIAKIGKFGRRGGISGSAAARLT